MVISLLTFPSVHCVQQCSNQHQKVSPRIAWIWCCLSWSVCVLGVGRRATSNFLLPNQCLKHKQDLSEASHGVCSDLPYKNINTFPPQCDTYFCKDFSHTEGPSHSFIKSSCQLLQTVQEIAYIYIYHSHAYNIYMHRHVYTYSSTYAHSYTYMCIYNIHIFVYTCIHATLPLFFSVKEHNDCKDSQLLSFPVLWMRNETHILC